MLNPHLAGWSGRRRLFWGLAAPGLAALYVRASETPWGHLSAAWLGLTAAAAVVGAAVLASYLPAQGWRPELGCSPCAAVAALSLVGSVIAVSAYGPSLVGPILAAAVSLYGLAQRIAQPASCSVPSPSGSSAR